VTPQPTLASDDTLVDGIVARCPAFVPDDTQPIIRTGKTALVAGTVDRAPAIAKQLTDTAELWRGHFRQEIAAYQIFTATPPPFRVPRLLFTDPDSAALLIVERIDGPPLATARYPAAALDAASRRSVLEAAQLTRRWRPPPASFPAAEYPERIARYQRRHHVLTDSAAAKLRDALASRTWPREFGHGDLLLANCLRVGDGCALIDWEYAGLYLPGYDLALLWIILEADPASRTEIARLAHGEGESLWRGFLLNRALLLARELRIHHEIPASPQVQHRLNALRADLDDTLDGLPTGPQRTGWTPVVGADHGRVPGLT